MKIGILTQPLHSNYGGLLQNYALQEVLRRMGHDPLTIDRHKPLATSFIKNVAKHFLQIVKSSYDSSLLTAKQKERLSLKQKTFVEINISKTGKFFSQTEFNSYISKHKLDAYIVGSDQCWRPCYSPNIGNYYLDFVDAQTKKIAYAASFGVDNWEYNNEDTQSARALAKRFDAISVRENTAVKLCKDKLGVDATWVLDPTMLLGKDGYMKFVTPNADTKYVLIYLLEESNEARTLVNNVARKLDIKEIRSNIASSIFHRGESLESHMNMPVEEWLSNIHNATFVVTDSFHGAVFCILFNVPFVVKLNSTRGNTRLESLLTDFGLQECICQDFKGTADFNWQRINSYLKERQTKSMQFLQAALA
jgi:hypothetical protein